MTRALVVTVRLHDGRFHGMGEWAPSPARLFQALIAGAARGAALDEHACRALRWLESLEPPAIAVPRMSVGQRVHVFGPDNDIDAVGNDPARVGEIRSPKTFEPRLFDANEEFVYAWVHDDDENAQTICRVAESLYQFGRGIDMAWAKGEVVTQEEFDARLSRHRGLLYRPTRSPGRTLACPAPGSLASLSARFEAGRSRFRPALHGKSGRQLFLQPPRPRFSQVVYDSPPLLKVFALRMGASNAAFFPYLHTRASSLITWIRDETASRLREKLPARRAEIERCLIGRKANGSDAGPTSERVRIVPLPSIGNDNVDRGIRRIVVAVPSGCPLRADDLWWAISGIESVSVDTGEVHFTVVPFESDNMLARYVESSRMWRTVTPVALPESVKRRRIDPARRVAEAKAGEERIEEQRRAAGAIVQALRQADVRTRAEHIRVQREPFEARGARVEAFAPGTRFAKERLWHVEVAFVEPVSGPLAIGDGRFLGLGVMAPARQSTTLQLGRTEFESVSDDGESDRTTEYEEVSE